jgi:hypothetical protein
MFYYPTINRIMSECIHFVTSFVKAKCCSYWLIYLVPIFSALVFFWHLEYLPVGTDYFDVCVKLNYAKEIEAGSREIFFPGTGREAAMPYLTAFFSLIIPQLYMAAKFGLASVAVIGMVIFYGAIRKFSTGIAGVVATSTLIFSFWYSNLLRSGYRSSLCVAIYAMLLCGLHYIQIENGKLGKLYKYFGAVICGAVLAAGLYCYTAGMLFAAVSLAVISIYIACKRNFSRLEKIIVLLLMFSAFLAVFYPFLSYIIEDPARYFGRQIKRSGEIAALTSAEKLKSLFDNYIVNQLGLFGDNLYRFELRGEAYWLLPIFTVGISTSLKRNYKDIRVILSVIVLAISPVASSAMSIGFPSEVPELPRLIFSLPCIALFTGIGFSRCLEIIESRSATHSIVRGGAVAAFIFTLFIRWQDLLSEWPTERRFGFFPVHEWAAEVSGRTPHHQVFAIGKVDRQCLMAYNVLLSDSDPAVPFQKSGLIFIDKNELESKLWTTIQANNLCKRISENPYALAYKCDAKAENRVVLANAGNQNGAFLQKISDIMPQSAQ